MPLFMCAGLAACASPFAERAQPDADGGFVVFDPVSDDLEQWEHYVLRKGETRYSMVDTPHGRLLEARGRPSASILVRVKSPVTTSARPSSSPSASPAYSATAACRHFSTYG